MVGKRCQNLFWCALIDHVTSLLETVDKGWGFFPNSMRNIKGWTGLILEFFSWGAPVPSAQVTKWSRIDWHSIPTYSHLIYLPLPPFLMWVSVAKQYLSNDAVHLSWPWWAECISSGVKVASSLGPISSACERWERGIPDQNEPKAVVASLGYPGTIHNSGMCGCLPFMTAPEPTSS